MGITLGDINGIGPEVVIKGLDNSKVLDLCTPVIYGSSKVLSYHRNIVKPVDFAYQNISNAGHLISHKINLVNCWQDDISISLGKPNELSGRFAYMALDQATRDLKEGLIDVLVTGPVDKHALALAGFPSTGQTEFLGQTFGSEHLMLMVSDELRIALASNHVPINQVAAAVTRENLAAKLRIFEQTLRRDFGIEKPLIAVLGLNPHAGDQGLVGDEEEQIIMPIIQELRDHGVFVGGPFSADGFFGSGAHRKVHGIFAMYHDQGLIPFKTLSFGQGVNMTAGLPFIRTSPDHGTAVDLAGKNAADHRSFLKALFLSLDLYRNRTQYQADRANALARTLQYEEEDGNALPEDFGE